MAYWRTWASIVLLLSLAGLIRLHFAWGWDWTDNSVALDAGRAQSLRLLADRLKQGSVLATTHHYVDVPKLPARSYQYAALARSYMLLEGWEYGMRDKRLLTAVQTDNETLFTTTDPEEARGIIDKYNVTHVLVEPGESLGFASDQVDWLRRIALGGTLTVYEVVRKEER